jgi:Fe-S-cluster-containing dehydrogenase component
MSVMGIIIAPNLCRGCHSCQLACSYARQRVFNPAKSAIIIERDIDTDHTVPMILPLVCNLCGGNPACVEACPYGTLTVNSELSGYKILVADQLHRT